MAFGGQGLRDRSTLRKESFHDCFSLSNAKGSTIKVFIYGGLVLLTLRTGTVFPKDFKKCRQFLCTCFLRSSKLAHLDCNYVPAFR